MIMFAELKSIGEYKNNENGQSTMAEDTRSGGTIQYSHSVSEDQNNTSFYVHNS